MPRAATNSDAFNAVAEPRRRAILLALAARELSVGALVRLTRQAQPSVSKHLRVLHQVGLVRARRAGRCVYYCANAEAIRPLHEWTSRFEALWSHQLERVRERVEASTATSATVTVKKETP